MRISGNLDLLEKRNYDTMPMGSGKKPGRRYYTEDFWNMQILGASRTFCIITQEASLYRRVLQKYMLGIAIRFHH